MTGALDSDSFGGFWTVTPGLRPFAAETIPRIVSLSQLTPQIILTSLVHLNRHDIPYG